MDVPTRQSYTMAVVDPDERAAAAGVLSVARNAGAAVRAAFHRSDSSDAGVRIAVLAGGRH